MFEYYNYQARLCHRFVPIFHKWSICFSLVRTDEAIKLLNSS